MNFEAQIGDFRYLVKASEDDCNLSIIPLAGNRRNVESDEIPDSSANSDSSSSNPVKRKDRGRCIPIIIPRLYIVWAEWSKNSDCGGVKLSYVFGKKASSRKTIFFKGIDEKEGRLIAESIMEYAYNGSPRAKRLKVLVNPGAGAGNGTLVKFNSFIMPFFKMANCTVDVEETSEPSHAISVCEHLDVSKFDALVVVSGDGLVFECLSGLAKQSNATRALAIPLAMIPAGSGNALCRSVVGSGSWTLATLHIIKGKEVPIDLSSITFGNERVISFLSQEVGWIADIDIGSENLRWMGGYRFAAAFLTRCLLRMSKFPCEIAMKVVESDKTVIQKNSHNIQSSQPTATAVDGPLPTLKYGDINSPIPEDWVRVQCPELRNLWAGNMPWMSKDGLFFPASQAGDGLLDLTILRGKLSRMRALTIMTKAESGDHFDYPEIDYYKVEAYRMIPAESIANRFIAFDGEGFPVQPFQVEVHRGMGRILSVVGGYQPVAKIMT